MEGTAVASENCHLLHGALCPVCAQCRSPMDIVLVAPDFENLMFATFRCGQCGLLDRREVQPDF